MRIPMIEPMMYNLSANQFTSVFGEKKKEAWSLTINTGAVIFINKRKSRETTKNRICGDISLSTIARNALYFMTRLFALR